MKVLTFTTLFPNNINPNHGIFIMERMKRVAAHCKLKVIAPVPYFPPMKVNKKWHDFSQIVRFQKMSEFDVYYPRYLITPKVGMFAYGLFIFLSTLKCVYAIRKIYDFDLFDAHYIYPDGLAAVLLGRFFRKPVVLSARGTDINLYPKFSYIRKQIIYTLKQANGIIAVCQALKDEIIEMGITSEKIKVISNGVDTEKFYPLNWKNARKMLNLPVDKKLILSVGNLIERKGFHYIIKAFKILEEKMGHMDCPNLMIAGEGEFRSTLEKLVADLGLKSKVDLVGAVAHDKLNLWYNACDIYILASSREGWPNVLSEALACGKPVVATNVWGVSEIINSNRYGILVENQDPQKLAEALMKALKTKWSVHDIQKYGQSNTWDKVALKVYQEFEKIYSSHQFK